MISFYVCLNICVHALRGTNTVIHRKCLFKVARLMLDVICFMLTLKKISCGSVTLKIRFLNLFKYAHDYQFKVYVLNDFKWVWMSLFYLLFQSYMYCSTKHFIKCQILNQGNISFIIDFQDCCLVRWILFVGSCVKIVLVS